MPNFHNRLPGDRHVCIVLESNSIKYCKDWYYNSWILEKHSGKPYIKVQIPLSEWPKGHDSISQWLTEHRYEWDPNDEEAMNA